MKYIEINAIIDDCPVTRTMLIQDITHYKTFAKSTDVSSVLIHFVGSTDELAVFEASGERVFDEFHNVNHYITLDASRDDFELCDKFGGRILVSDIHIVKNFIFVKEDTLP